MNKSLSFVGSITLVCFICISLMNTFVVLAETKFAVDPLLQIEKDVRAYAQYVEKAEENKICELYQGVVISTYNKYQIDPKNLIREVDENTTAVTVRKRLTEIDRMIQEDIITPFRTSQLACSPAEADKLKYFLQNISPKRELLQQWIQEDSEMQDRHGKCNDEQDPNSFTCSETSRLWDRLMEKLKILSDTQEEMTSKESDSLLKKLSFELSEAEKKDINTRANQRAEDYYNNFWTGIDDAWYAPIYESRSEVLRNLEQLPEGRSKESSFEWDFKTPLVNTDYEELRKKLEDDHLATFKQKFQLYTQVDQVNEIEFTQRNFDAMFKEIAMVTEKWNKYDKPMTDSALKSLVPFHQTLQNTTKTLNAQTKAIKNVNSRQNVY